MIQGILQAFIYLLIIDVIVSYFPDLKSQGWAQKLRMITDIPQKPIRDLLPKNLPFDPAPMILIFLIQIVMYLI